MGIGAESRKRIEARDEVGEEVASAWNDDVDPLDSGDRLDVGGAFSRLDDNSDQQPLAVAARVVELGQAPVGGPCLGVADAARAAVGPV